MPVKRTIAVLIFSLLFLCAGCAREGQMTFMVLSSSDAAVSSEQSAMTASMQETQSSSGLTEHPQSASSSIHGSSSSHREENRPETSSKAESAAAGNSLLLKEKKEAYASVEAEWKACQLKYDAESQQLEQKIREYTESIKLIQEQIESDEEELAELILSAGEAYPAEIDQLKEAIEKGRQELERLEKERDSLLLQQKALEQELAEKEVQYRIALLVLEQEIESLSGK